MLETELTEKKTVVVIEPGTWMVFDEAPESAPEVDEPWDREHLRPGAGLRRDSRGRPVDHPVCMTRHLRGCPVNSVCPSCRTCSVLAPGEACGRWGCAGTLVGAGSVVT